MVIRSELGSPKLAPIQVGHLGLHHCLHQHLEPLAQKVEVCVRRLLAQQLQHVIPSVAIAFTLFIFVVDEGDAVARVLPSPAVSCTISRDTTAA